ncbi:MAG: hypothetical protein QOJ27_760 [Sphingomonadales bacterium]|nr:hypothetical protein [Sphingomonadales bacterium]
MPYLKNFSHDVFISFSMDNDAYALGNEAWVAKFNSELIKMLKNKLPEGGKNVKTFYAPLDHQAGDLITSCLEGVANSAVLLIIGSPRWISDPYPKSEFAAFQEKFGAEEGRIFIAELEPLSGQDYPAQIKDVLRLEFWRLTKKGNARPIQNIDDQFSDSLADLAGPIARKLQELAGTPAVPPRAPNPNFKTVLLTQTTDDLLCDVESLRSALGQLDIAVLSSQTLPIEGAEFIDRFDALVGKADIVVQLLSENPGRKPPDLPQGYQQAQMDAVRAKPGKILMQWRDLKDPPPEVADSAHRRLLEGDKVQISTLAEFQAEVVRLATAPREPDRRKIFISFHPADNLSARKIVEKCVERRKAFTTPVHGADTTKISEEKYRSDQVVILYGRSQPQWAGPQIRLYGKATKNVRPATSILWLGCPRKEIVDLPEYDPVLDVIIAPDDNLDELFRKIF